MLKDRKPRLYFFGRPLTRTMDLGNDYYSNPNVHVYHSRISNKWYAVAIGTTYPAIEALGLKPGLALRNLEKKIFARWKIQGEHMGYEIEAYKWPKRKKVAS